MPCNTVSDALGMQNHGYGNGGGFRCRVPRLRISIVESTSCCIADGIVEEIEFIHMSL
jgi:hypothetical protein